MRTLAEEIVANDPSKLPEGETEVTQENYFKIASLERLGTEQSAQFQSGEQKGTGWHWGSRLNEAGEILYSLSSSDTTAVNADDDIPIFHIGDLNWVESNSYAEMPRSYDNGNNTFGAYYTWYSATAESGTYESSGDNAADSVCPNGWSLPSGENNYGSWWDLILNTYQVPSNTAPELILNQPISLTFSGYYGLSAQAPYQQNSVGRFWTSYASSKIQAQYLNFTKTNTQTKYVSYGKPNGLSVRCVKK